jgi:predicted metalloendopeptidase
VHHRARNLRQSEAILRWRTDPHSPCVRPDRCLSTPRSLHTLRTKFRVNAALANIKEFGAAWGCKAGRDKMSRGNESCIIW